jgi:DNA primase
VRGKSAFFSPFEERIIFPICDHLGRYCGFGGRIFKEHDARAKYYNSKESAHFIKGSLLFGLEQAKKEMQKSGTVFLVEGYTDCITMAQYGYTNTLATLGTACTLEHLSALARYVQRVFVIFDGDKAGNDAIIRLTKLCWQVDMELYVICLPSGDDPASFLSKQNSLEPFIQQAQDIFLFFIKTLGEGFTNQPLANKLARIRQLLPSLAIFNSRISQNTPIEPT